MLIHDGEQFINCNKAAANILGYTSRKEFMSVDFTELYDNNQPNGNRSIKKFEKMLKMAADKGVVHDECLFTKKDSSLIWVDVTMSQISLSNKKVIHILWKDISARKALEKEVSEYTKELELKVEKRTKSLKKAKLKAEKATEEKSFFLANMSHELRTPLNAIIGFSQMLKSMDDSKEKTKKFIDNINSSGNNLLRLINSILDFSKLEAKQLRLEKSEIDLYELLKNTMEQFELQVNNKGLELELNYEEDVNRKFEGDSLRIYQFLTNLLNNAIKFTESGSVCVNVRQREKGTFRLEVVDTGVGLSEQQISKLFQPFSQANESIAKNMVERV